MRAALVNSSGLVENVILLDEDSDFEPSEGLTLIILDEKDIAAPGFTWRNGKWVAPTPATPAEIPVSVEAQLEELRATIDMLLLKSLEG